MNPTTWYYQLSQQTGQFVAFLACDAIYDTTAGGVCQSQITLNQWEGAWDMANLHPRCGGVAIPVSRKAV